MILYLLKSWWITGRNRSGLFEELGAVYFLMFPPFLLSWSAEDALLGLWDDIKDTVAKGLKVT